MPNLSSSDRLRVVKAKTLARYHAANPTMPDMAKKGQSNEIRILREVGTKINCTNNCT
jgi:hypothetical protein